jgi:alpha-D-ribose 1-methylphosphonate 5-triphosphate synthase subunit PhnI
MAYVAVKGGEKAIDAAHRLLAKERRGDTSVPELTLAQISQQLALSVDRVMTEGSIYDRELAALAIKQARGDLVEAIFLLRAYRATLPRLAESEPIDTSRMQARRRISAIFKDVPGGQMLGGTFDYTHRLLDFSLAAAGSTYPEMSSDMVSADADHALPRILGIMGAEGLIQTERRDATTPPPDLTREPLEFPASRATRLQNLARGDEGFLLALGYSTQRGYGRNHPFAGEIRIGEIEVVIEPAELGFALSIGDITVTECETVNQFTGSKHEPAQFTRGYGLSFGEAERKAMAMALVDRALRATELGEDVAAPAQDEEFVLYHSDNVEASGFVQHLKLPHYVDFQSELNIVRKIRADMKHSTLEREEVLA